MTQEIQTFIRKFERKYGQSIEVTVGVDESSIITNKNTLKGIESFAIIQMHQRNPEYSHIKNFKHRTRRIDYMRYSQAFQYIAHLLGYKKVRIAKLVNRNHATVINSIRQAENYLFWGCPDFIDIYYPLLAKIETYVGSLSDDVKRQTFSKPMFTTYGSAKKNISAIDQPVFRGKELS